MKISTITTITYRRSVLVVVVAIFLCSTNQSVDCDDEDILMTWLSYMDFPAICDLEYREKYFDDDEHRDAIAAGILYDPPLYDGVDESIIPEVINDDDGHPGLFLDNNDDDASPFMTFADDSTEFIGGVNGVVDRSDTTDRGDMRDYDDDVDDGYNDEEEDWDESETNVGFRENYEITPRNYSELYDFGENWKFEKSNGWDVHRRRLNKFRENANFRERIDDSQAIGNSFGNENRSSAVKKRDFRMSGFESYDNDAFYTMMDTFGPMYDGRRGEIDDYVAAVSEARNKKDRCEAVRRIVGGFSVESAEVLPFMVFVDSGCGGSIIGESWVITAAHCVDGDEPRYVHVGSIKLMTGCQYTISHTYIHPHYSRKHLDSDIALLKISPTFVYSPAIKSIPLSNAKAQRHSCGIVAGWGAEEYKGTPRIMLSMTTIPVVSRKLCQKLGIRKFQFCAGYQDGRSDACQGDSGGPFAVDGFLVGVVSFGYKCAKPNTPGVYVDVYYYRKWIRLITGI